jgi:hypothetical protein
MTWPKKFLGFTNPNWFNMKHDVFRPGRASRPDPTQFLALSSRTGHPNEKKTEQKLLVC